MAVEDTWLVNVSCVCTYIAFACMTRAAAKHLPADIDILFFKVWGGSYLNLCCVVILVLFYSALHLHARHVMMSWVAIHQCLQ